MKHQASVVRLIVVTLLSAVLFCGSSLQAAEKKRNLMLPGPIMWGGSLGDMLNRAVFSKNGQINIILRSS